MYTCQPKKTLQIDRARIQPIIEEKKVAISPGVIANRLGAQTENMTEHAKFSHFNDWLWDVAKMDTQCMTSMIYEPLKQIKVLQRKKGPRA